jgi:diguanylate cyclase (GGDEF)-like protein
MEYERSTLLIQFFCLISAVAAIAWAIMAKPVGIAPKASWRFSLANLCLGVGLMVYTQRTELPNYLAWITADIILLSGFSFLRQGTQALFKMPSRFKQDISIIATTTAALLLMPYLTDPIPYMVIIMSLATSGMFFLLALDNYHAQKANLSQLAILIILAPLAAVSLLFLIRAVIVVFDPSKLKNIAAINSMEAEPVLWTYVMLVLLVNLILISNAIIRLIQKIRNIANRDHLTKLWNRHALNTHLIQVQALWQRNQQSYSLLVVDIDHFKKINDNHGHAVGDAALQHVAELLLTSLRKVDFIYRYGGEEFLIVLPDTQGDEAMVVANKIKHNLSQSPFNVSQQSLLITVSIGCATMKADLTHAQLLQMADKAMYQAKNKGRNTICQADMPTLMPKAIARVEPTAD